MLTPWFVCFLQRWVSGNLFGGDSKKFKMPSGLFPGAKHSSPLPSPSSGSQGKRRPKISSKKPKVDAYERFKRQVPPEIDSLHSLQNLKDFLHGMPRDQYNTLSPDLKATVDAIANGELDDLDQSQIEGALRDAKDMTELGLMQGGKRSILRSTTSTEASELAEQQLQDKTTLQKLAEQAARTLLTMSDDDWKSAGIEKPDFSKPLPYSKLVEIDMLLGNKGIKESDFKELMTEAELKHSEVEGEDGEPIISEAHRASKEFKMEQSLSDAFDNSDAAAEGMFNLIKKRTDAKLKRLATKAKAKSKWKKLQDTLKPDDLYNTMFDAAKRGEWDIAIDTFQDALTWNTSYLEFEPVTLKTINLMIGIYCEMKDVASAAKTMELIPKYEYDANADTYNNFLAMAAETRDDRLAHEWYGKMLEAGIKPNSKSYSHLILLYAYLGDSLNAHKWFNEMNKNLVPEDSTPYAHLIFLHGVVLDDLTEALSWAKKMVQSEIPRNEYTSDVVAQLHKKVVDRKTKEAQIRNSAPKTPQQQFVEAYSNGDNANVEKIWESMRYNNLVLSEGMWSLRIQHAANLAQLKEASQLFDELVEAGHKPSRTTCGIMSQVYRRLGDIEKSQEALKMTDSAPPTEPLVQSFNLASAPIFNPYRPQSPQSSRLR